MRSTLTIVGAAPSSSTTRSPFFSDGSRTRRSGTAPRTLSSPARLSTRRPVGVP